MNPQESLEFIPIGKVLELEGGDIAIPRPEVVNVGPEEEAYAQYFHCVEIRSFGDLQALTLVPEGLDEEAVRQAMAEDDAEALSAARHYLQTHTKAGVYSCGEPEDGIPLKFSYRSDLRTTYDAIRKTQNPHLSRLLSDLYEKEVAWDSLVPAHIRGWIYKLSLVGSIPLVVSKIKDITIMHNATLNMTASVKLVLANDIRIYMGGVLKLNSSYTKIQCASIQGDIP